MTYLDNLGFNNLASRRYEQPEADIPKAAWKRINNLYSYHVKTTEGEAASFYCRHDAVNVCFI